MKQIFDRSIYLSFDGGKTWEDTELLVNWQYLQPELAKEISCTIDTYDRVRSFVIDLSHTQPEVRYEATN